VSVTRQIVGGASGGIGSLAVTFPLAALTISDSGVSIDVRSRMMRRLTRPLTRLDYSAAWWMVDWADLESVDLAPRSVVLRPRRRDGFRFVTLTSKGLLPLVRELEGRHIVVTRVRTTIGWFFNPG
jgi:hypothetical protein